MKTGANLLTFGEALKHEMSRIVADLPIGVGVHLVADQPVLSSTQYQASRKRCSKQLSLFLLSVFSALAFGPVSSLRSQSRWFSRSLLL